MTCPSQPGSMKPAVEWMSRPRRPSDDLPFEPRHEVVGKANSLQCGAEHELAGMEDERLLFPDLHELGQLFLWLTHVDVGIPSVVEDPKEPIHAHVDARGLDQLLVEWVDLDAAFAKEAANRSVGEDHARTLASSGTQGYGHAHEKSSSYLGAPDLRRAAAATAGLALGSLPLAPRAPARGRVACVRTARAGCLAGVHARDDRRAPPRSRRGGRRRRRDVRGGGPPAAGRPRARRGRTPSTRSRRCSKGSSSSPASQIRRPTATTAAGPLSAPRLTWLCGKRAGRSPPQSVASPRP